MSRAHVVIVGGGFGGLYAARSLADEDVRVTLVDKENHHLFQPLLYQVATAALNPSDIASPIRHILQRQSNVTVLLADAQSVDLAQKKLILADGELAYDQLILATGATHSYFGHPEWETFAPGLKTLTDALEIRRRILYAYEVAERTKQEREAYLTFVVIGGGPTGVEMAGALAEIARHALRSDFRNIQPEQAKILLLEGADRLLTTYPPELSLKAKKQLEDLGAEVRLDTRVTAVDQEGVTVLVKTGEVRIPSKTVVWAAGVQASPLAKSLGVPLDRAGRVLVTPTLNVPGHDNVYVIGDLASVTVDGKPVPGVAPAAIQGGQYAARTVLRRLAERPVEPFHYNDKGSLATIGRAAAVADFGRLRFGGFFAWAAWLFIHILFLIGFRNRALVILEWFWAYVTFQRGARLIVDNRRPNKLLPEASAKKV